MSFKKFKFLYGTNENSPVRNVMLDDQLVEVNLKDFSYKKHIVEAVKPGYHHKETETYRIQR